jgi:Fic family protein
MNSWCRECGIARETIAELQKEREYLLGVVITANEVIKKKNDEIDELNKLVERWRETR